MTQKKLSLHPVAQEDQPIFKKYDSKNFVFFNKPCFFFV